ncbi:hypothetical protein [Thalassolituus sp. C2-1]|uniref:hypothetical protein n=1 Tax=Venatorbacter sp. C2-1 TaxID=2597518 RepID=UPI00119770A3|nr:hypothetical protein [Thalassolituus sp. C2-1]TVV43110.1 hypothetical protein FOT50_11750 [Thalassolituus sp. C2-1]
MADTLSLLQIGTNGFALFVAGWIYAAYIKNIRASLTQKDEQIKTVEKNLLFWKDKAREFEKKTPEYIEEILAKRIKHREEEIERLDKDRESGTKLLGQKTAEVARLKEQLENATYLGRALTYYDIDSDEDVVIPESDIEVEHLGEIFVDSASILITDPMYVDHEWRRDVEYEDSRIYKYVPTGKIYRFGVDFSHYEEIIPDLNKTPNVLIKENNFVQLELERKFTYSLPGSMYASSSKSGYAELEFRKGHTGAGICVRTVHGDGGYQVYGERYKGNIYRIYIDLQ